MNTQIHMTPAHQLIETWHQAIKIWQGSENTEMQQLWRRRNSTDMSAISTKLSQSENARIARTRRNAIFAKLVVSLCLNLKSLVIGSMCDITDQCFDQILINNRLQYLEQVEIRRTELLTMKTISNLLLHCDNIKSILDIEGWAGVDRADLEELIIHMKQNNVDICLREQEKDSRCVHLQY